MKTTTGKQPQRSAKVQKIGTSTILWLSVGRLTTAYRLTPLVSLMGGTAFRLEKADQGDGPPEVYDVLLDPKGFDSCDCLGFTKWHHCKHRDGLQTLVKAGKL